MSKASIETDIRDYGLYDWPRADNLYGPRNLCAAQLSDNEAKLFDRLMQHNSSYNGYELSKGEIKTVLQAFERLKRTDNTSSDTPELNILHNPDVVPVKGSITEACILIQNDLLSCKDAVSLGRKYATYENILKSFFLRALQDLYS